MGNYYAFDDDDDDGDGVKDNCNVVLSRSYAGVPALASVEVAR